MRNSGDYNNGYVHSFFKKEFSVLTVCYVDRDAITCLREKNITKKPV